MELSEFKYPEPVKVEIKVRKGLRKTTKTMWTYKNPDGSLWEERFEGVGKFCDGLAPVKLEDGSYTFVSFRHTLWEERFEDAKGFSEGLASVKLQDGWTYVDVKRALWTERFEKAGGFGDVSGKGRIVSDGIQFTRIPGIASVTLKNGERYIVDHDKNMCQDKYRYTLEDMSADEFLGLETDCFEDEGFVKMAVGFVKRDLLKQVEGRKEVDDEYAKYCNEELAALQEKIDKEKAEIERLAKDKPKSDAKREELIKKIEDFEITREKK